MEVREQRFVRRLKPPPAFGGIMGILPGQVVVRCLSDAELDHVDDTYVIEMPAHSRGSIFFEPLNSAIWRPYEVKHHKKIENIHDFIIGVARQGMLPVKSWLDVDAESYRFDADERGLYEIRIASGIRGPRVPDRYSLSVWWGDASAHSMNSDVFDNFRPSIPTDSDERTRLP